MVNKNRRKVFKVPENLPAINTDLLKEKEVDLSSIEIKKQEDLKERLERLKRFKEAEKKKLEEIERLQQAELQKLDNKIEDIKTYKEGDTDKPVYGVFLENQGEDGVQVKVYDSESCEKFEYAADNTTFQESLMEFFKDVPAVINEVELGPRKVDKIIMEAPKEIKKPDKPIDFTKNVKALIDKRKNMVNNQYVKHENPIAQVSDKLEQIIDEIIPHRNDSVLKSTGRSSGPTSRTSGKLSNYKRGM